jgi:serine protease Do
VCRRIASALLVVVVLLPAVAARDAGAGPREAEELVFLLQYIAVDYGIAVSDEGEVVNAFEYEEMLGMSRLVLDRYRALHRTPAAAPTVDGLERLQQSVRERRPWEQVRSLADELAAAMIEEEGLATKPAKPPDLALGRGLYRTDCAPCHGPSGAGDGWAAPGMDPPPSSFRDAPRMQLISAHQVTGAIEFGIDGTAMPSYAGVYSPEQRWSLAFFVTSLHAASAAAPAEAEPAAEEATDPGLAVALQLERTFARVAEGVYPGVAGVSLYRKKPAATPATEEAWREAGQRDPYPGYRRVRSGSGFFVSPEGHVITCAHLLLEGGELPEDGIVDVETTGNLNFRAHVIGIEPTVDLAVLKTEAPISLRALELGDSGTIRVGQWVIAVADPPGLDKTFAPGTLAARPERDCYQESRTSTLLQSSVRVSPESYGGPLVDIRGLVIGMAVPGSSVLADAAEGATYGLPVDLVRTLYEALKESASKRSPWLGIAVRNLDRELRQRLASVRRTGVYIDDVFDPSPASRAGIRVGDVLTSMDGQRVFTVRDFQRWLYLLGIGRTITLEIGRDGTLHERRVTIEHRPDGATPR